MRASLLFFFFIYSLSFGAYGTNCQKRALQGLLKEHIPVRSITVTYDEFRSKEAVFKKLDNKPHYVSHLRGEFSYHRGNPVQEVKLESGLHTSEALSFFQQMRPDIASDISLKTLPNGVQVASIPKAGFSHRRQRFLVTRVKYVDGREIIYSDKTLFPVKWSDDEIVRAVEAVKNNKSSFTKIDNESTIVTGNYKNVKIRVVIRDGEVKTAFPLAR